MIKLLQLTLGLLFILTLQAQAAEEQRPLSADQPIEITARQLEAFQQQGKAIFSGSVVAKQGNITLYCEKLVAYTQTGQQQVDHLEAFGNVRVVQLNRTATADRAIYRHRQGTLVLIGHAELHQEQNQVSGAEITVFLKENRSVVKSNDGGRVKALLFPEPKQEQ